jgi:hypothetical protein
LPVRVVRADSSGPITETEGAFHVVAVRENGAVWLIIRDEGDETPTTSVMA